ncbi:uncharacterized protein BDZ83DRAFT_635902 [Colletotrichum acutatum]|uniref:Uncharacterized protein n=1 Tax=Glomerella acutata TaxID=27357 RepID=A0AAD8UCA8_GLOAC|nr:uncharacterized protein BDZ83DRAFT_635902 [Colletotrichum acutatum]KAK1715065.1 hypothetical protein BDZ83DRAFT_635902 [Colletotrichum acutatum]
MVYVGSFLSDGRGDQDIDFSLPCRPVSISFLSPAEKADLVRFLVVRYRSVPQLSPVNSSMNMGPCDVSRAKDNIPSSSQRPARLGSVWSEETERILSDSIKPT